ncbi:MAG: histidinol dehydrogenase [Pseudomonadota bacterium]
MSALTIRRLDTRDAGFAAALATATSWSEERDAAVEQTVAGILADVRARGDAAVLEYTHRFDRRSAASVASLEISCEALAAATARVPAPALAALKEAATRIRAFHEKQRVGDWEFTDAAGNRLGQRVTPLDRVGLYVPGGKASYPSSVLMNAIPAKVAGVPEVIMVVPAPGGELNDLVLAAAQEAGVDRVFTVGGAQAVAALAFGTETIPAVDKIVGPGNIYVATAKKQVFGKVGIDMIAGPSEILVICDGKTDPDWIALDLFSQAEHDENAQSILVTADARFLDEVQASMERLLPSLPRADVIRASVEGRGLFVLARDTADCCDVANRVAPEHLELSVAHPETLLPLIRHAGAIFMGRHTPEAIGDYCAGPNHVLPTSGTARFSSPLGVYDFQKRSSLIFCSPGGARVLGRIADTLAQCEGLDAHARSAAARVSASDARDPT